MNRLSSLALLIAVGIGLHSFGEGLAIGGSAAIGAISLATLLVIGFALHNATEGFGIVAPLADGLLTISAKHSEEKKTERDGFVRQEVVSGNFYRQIPVGQIDPNTVSADVENGVLTVTLPAPIEPQPVKIAINPASSRNAQESGRAEPAAKSA